MDSKICRSQFTTSNFQIIISSSLFSKEKCMARSAHTGRNCCNCLFASSQIFFPVRETRVHHILLKTKKILGGKQGSQARGSLTKQPSPACQSRGSFKKQGGLPVILNTRYVVFQTYYPIFFTDEQPGRRHKIQPW